MLKLLEINDENVVMHHAEDLLIDIGVTRQILEGIRVSVAAE
jgi:hypothetical protein